MKMCQTACMVDRYIVVFFCVSKRSCFLTPKRGTQTEGPSSKRQESPFPPKMKLKKEVHIGFWKRQKDHSKPVHPVRATLPSVPDQCYDVLQGFGLHHESNRPPRTPCPSSYSHCADSVAFAVSNCVLGSKKSLITRS